VLVVHGLDCPVDARQSNDHLVTEPIQRVVRPRGGNRLERKTCPVRKLAAINRPMSDTSDPIFAALRDEGM